MLECHLYRNSQDRRVIQSTELLYQAIAQLLTVKPFDKIGIKEVSTNAGIGRATFYRNFDYVEDVFRFKIDQKFNQLKEIIEFDEKGNYELINFFEFWEEHYQLLELLVKADQWGLFTERFNQASKLKIVETSEELNFGEDEQAYLLASSKAIFSSVLYTWLLRGRKENAQELMHMLSLPFQVYAKNHMVD